MEKGNPLDIQEGGSHYKNWKIQPLDFVMANGLNPCQHSIIKYVCRFREKGGREDLIKARHYIDLLIHFEYEQSRDARPETEATETECPCKRTEPASVPTEGR